jgi:hypothetical protein
LAVIARVYLSWAKRMGFIGLMRLFVRVLPFGAWKGDDMRRAARADLGQAEAVADLRFMGYSVAMTHMVGNGFPDFIVGGLNLNTNTWCNLMVEWKSERGEMTPAEAEFAAKWPGPYIVAYSVDDVLRSFGRM